MNDLDQFGQALASLIGVKNTESGKLGYIVNGEWHVVDPDNPSNMLVRFVNGTHVSARNERGVAPKYDMAVIVGTDFLGRPVILGEDVPLNQSFHPPGGGGGSIPYHSHVRGSGLEFIIDEWMFKHLRVTTSPSTLSATISAGMYLYNHDLRWRIAGTLDLTSYVPATYNYFTWVVVGIDPATDTFVAVASPEALLSEIVANPADIPLADFLANDYIPLAAVWLLNGDTGIPLYRVEDLRNATGSIFWYLEDLVNVSSDSDYEDYVLTRKGNIWIGQPLAEIGDNVVGNLGTTDNAVVRTDGTGGSSVQGSNATIDDSGNLNLHGAQLQDFAEKTLTAASSSPYAIDWSAATLFEVTLGQNTTLTFSNLTAGRSITLILIQDGTGGWTTTFPASVQWVNGTPTLHTGAGEYDVLTFIVRADGTTVEGFSASDPTAFSGANTALDNLASVAINTSLISDTDNTDDLGSSAKKWRGVYSHALTLKSRTPPSTPASGDGHVYIDTSDNKLKYKNDAGDEIDLTQQAASSPPAFGTGVTKTLDASGVATAGTDRHLIIESNSGTSDTLTEISDLAIGEGCIIRAASGHTITVEHNNGSATDKILLHNGANITLSGDKLLALYKTEAGKVVQPVDENTGGSGGAMVQISQQVLGSANATVTFSSISGSYNKLILQITARGDTAAQTIGVNIQFNNDTGSNYDYERLVSSSAGVSRSGGAAQTSGNLGNITAASGAAGQGSSMTVELPDYANTTFRKQYKSSGGYRNVVDATGGYVNEQVAGNWRSTSAISEIDVLCATGNFNTGSIFTLYGIA